jgi:Putative metallopeptidase domain
MASSVLTGFAARQGGGFFAGGTEIEAQLLEGTIGEAATIELVAFLRLFRQLPSVQEILLNPDTAPVPDEPSARISRSRYRTPLVGGRIAHGENAQLRLKVGRIQKSRAALLLDHPFFGTLLFRLRVRPRTSIETMATDGVSLFYTRKFVETLSAAQLMGVLAHEVMHPALQHHTRRNGRNPRHWNMACDYAINPMLVDAGLTLPEGVLLEDRFRGMSAERIYNLLEEEEQSQQPSQDEDSRDSDSSANGQDAQPSNGAGDEDDDVPSTPKTPGGIGQVLDAPEPAGEEDETVAEQARDSLDGG